MSKIVAVLPPRVSPVLCVITLFMSAILAIALWVPRAYAQLTIEITSGVDNPTRIAVVPFRREDVSGVEYEDIAAIIQADLSRSGRFEVLPRRDMLSSPATREEMFFRDWSALGAEYVVIGRTRAEANQLLVAYELYDVHTKRRLFAREIKGDLGSPRYLAHKISDRVYHELTGIPGAFSSRILYVSVTGAATKQARYRLLVADADGANAQEMLASDYPILSPAWSPDGKQVAYVSFEKDRPSIYRQELATSRRERLTNFSGLNSAPAWSPDGSKLAMVLSKDGNPEIYVMDLSTKALQRVTDHYAIDTEPDWMPDGKSLLFTSDRGGQPQIYQVVLATGEVKRVTYRGSYNAAADILPDGKSMVMIHRDTGDYHIAWQELKTGRVIVLTRSMLDESPSVAPNGSMLLYATKYRGKGVLAAVAIDGGFKFRLPSPASEVREPAWSPVY